MNLAVAIKATSKSMGLLSKQENGETLVKRCVINMFIGTSMYFSKVLPDTQANVIAEELLANYEYRQLKLEDVLAICYELKEADIINLTPARILRQIKDYCRRRESAVIHQSISHSETQKNASFGANFDDRVKNTIRHIDRTNMEIAKGRVKTRKYYKP
ncbi:hypothetical protein C1A40_03040 [Tamlana carrageenivorans]|uniref:Uncharacterized protein n=2 Tax=Pseudotamlana carrageenivorans TaxID=2069432 RepID=A0A2I7SF70_9FLAO|nr:hypothetical protein C1A40_03040 [Tamlana carrageenivorans]